MKSTTREDFTTPVVGLIASTKKAANARGDLRGHIGSGPSPLQGHGCVGTGTSQDVPQGWFTACFPDGTAC